MQLCKAKVHLEVVGAVVTVHLQHTFRNSAPHDVRFLYDLKVPADSQIVAVRAWVDESWDMVSAVAPVRVQESDGREVSFRPGMWPHADFQTGMPCCNPPLNQHALASQGDPLTMRFFVVFASYRPSWIALWTGV